jgi:hypothetical protein
MALSDVKNRPLHLPAKPIILSDGGGLQRHVYPDAQPQWRMARTMQPRMAFHRAATTRLNESGKSAIQSGGPRCWSSAACR